MSPTHEYMRRMVDKLIESQLTTILKTTSNQDTKQLINGIISLGTSAIYFDDLKTFRSPDEQFRYEETRYPGVVIEVAYSQSFKKLRRKAFDLILNSDGKIQLVIGLDIKSQKSKSFNISAWRPGFFRFENQKALRVKTVIDQDIVRDSDGTIRPGNLRFSLQDFSKDLATKYPNADLTEEVILSYDVLAQYLIATEQWKDKLSSSPPSSPLLKFGYASSSEEELASEREEKFRNLEKRSDERSEALDPDYSGRSRKRIRR